MYSNQATIGKTARACGTIWQYLHVIDEALTSQQLLMHAKVLVAVWLVEHHANVAKHAKGH